MKVDKFKLVRRRFDLRELLDRCVAMFKWMAEKKHISLSLNYQAEEVVTSDENRIKQVVMNLIGNAFKFTLAGSIEVRVIRILGEHVRVQVVDTGIGIKDEEKGSLMIAFGKSESDESKQLNRQGVGLGLLISNMIVRSLSRRNNGLQFTSVWNEGWGIDLSISSGSTFYFDIDIEDETERELEKHFSESKKDGIILEQIDESASLEALEISSKSFAQIESETA